MGEAGDALLQEVAFYQRGRSYRRFASICFFLLLSPLSPLSCPSHSSTWMMILKPRRKVSHFRNCSSTQNESGPKQLSLKGNRRHWRWKKPTLGILFSSFLLICYLSLFPLNFSGEFQLENIRSSGNKPLGFATTQKLPVENKLSQIHKWTNSEIHRKVKLQ